MITKINLASPINPLGQLVSVVEFEEISRHNYAVKFLTENGFTSLYAKCWMDYGKAEFTIVSYTFDEIKIASICNALKAFGVVKNWFITGHGENNCLLVVSLIKVKDLKL